MVGGSVHELVEEADVGVAVYRVGEWCVRRRRLVLLGWLLVVGL